MLKTFLIVMLLASATTVAQRSRPQDVELQKAIRVETIDGDVQSAIRLYAVLADKYSKSDPDIASQALLRLGQSYQALGDARARSTFERIEREFPAQRQAVAAASQALGATKGIAQERIWAGTANRTILSVSPDGRWTAVSGPDGFSLRRVSGEKDEASYPMADAPVFSPDSKQIAFNNWGKREFVIARADGSGAQRTVRVNPPDVRFYNPGAWSPDGQRILVEIVHQDFAKDIAWLSVKTGDLAVLANVGWRRNQGRPERLSLSPDARSIVYSGLTVAPAAPLSNSSPDAARSLFILSADGGAPKELVSGDVNLGPLWAPDGRHVVYVSNRGGTFGLWSIRADEGAKSRVLEMPATGRIVPIGITTAGTLFFGRDQQGNDLMTANVKPDGRVDAPVPLTTPQTGGNFSPAWSPDGRFIAYKRRLKERPDVAYALVIHTVADHSERVFDTRGLAFGVPVWLADSRRLLVAETATPGRPLLFDLGSGSFTTYADALGFALPPGSLGFDLSPDNKTLYTAHLAPAPSSQVTNAAAPTVANQPIFTLTAVDLTTGARRLILPAEDRGPLRARALSPDGKSMAAVVNRPGTQDVPLLRVELASGVTTELAPSVDPRILTWAPDSRAIYVLQRQGETSHLMRIAASGGALQDTGLVVPFDRQRGASLHGTTLLFDQESALHEVWVVKGLYPR